MKIEIKSIKLSEDFSIIVYWNTYRNHDESIPKYEYYLRYHNNEYFEFGGNCYIEADDLINSGWFNLSILQLRENNK